LAPVTVVWSLQPSWLESDPQDPGSTIPKGCEHPDQHGPMR